jgi:hypothetical protein
MWPSLLFPKARLERLRAGPARSGPSTYLARHSTPSSISTRRLPDARSSKPTQIQITRPTGLRTLPRRYSAWRGIFIGTITSSDRYRPTEACRNYCAIITPLGLMFSQLALSPGTEIPGFFPLGCKPFRLRFLVVRIGRLQFIFFWNPKKARCIVWTVTIGALRTCVVSPAEEYRAYADECLGWAKTAQSEKEREIFLQMAKTWMDAALIAQERDPPFLPPFDLTRSTPNKDDNAVT